MSVMNDRMGSGVTVWWGTTAFAFLAAAVAILLIALGAFMPFP